MNKNKDDHFDRPFVLSDIHSHRVPRDRSLVGVLGQSPKQVKGAARLCHLLGELGAAEDVEVQVGHGLTSVRAAI